MSSAIGETCAEKPDPQEATGLAFVAGFFFSFRVILVLLCARMLGAEPSTGAAVGLALNFLLLGLVCFQSLGHVQRSIRSMLSLPAIRWVIGFLLLSLCSLLWSDTVSLPASLAYWCGMAADAAVVLLLFRAGSVPLVSESMLKGFVWGVVGIALVAWVMPANSDLRLGDEDFFNTNQIGNLCAFAIFFAQLLMRHKNVKLGLVTAFLTITLIRSLSKTTIVAFLLAQCFLLFRDRSVSLNRRLLLVAAAVVATFVFWGFFTAYYEIYTSAGNQAETLTGRTGIWATVLAATLDKPWFGHGFDSMWKVIPPFGPDRFEARHAENEMLQQFYAYGVVGVCMLVGLYGSIWLQFKRLSRGPVRILLLSLLLFVVIRGLAEAEPFDLLLPIWSIILLSLLVEGSVPVHNEADLALPADQLQTNGRSKLLSTG